MILSQRRYSFIGTTFSECRIHGPPINGFFRTCRSPKLSVYFSGAAFLLGTRYRPSTNLDNKGPSFRATIFQNALHLDRRAAGDDGFASPRGSLIHIGCVEYDFSAGLLTQRYRVGRRLQAAGEEPDAAMALRQE